MKLVMFNGTPAEEAKFYEEQQERKDSFSLKIDSDKQQALIEILKK